jgi:hypothetical protein
MVKIAFRCLVILAAVTAMRAFVACDEADDCYNTLTCPEPPDTDAGDGGDGD